MQLDKEWTELERSIKGGPLVLKNKRTSSQKVSIKTQEKKGTFIVEVKGMAPSTVTADVEGEYLCIRERPQGVAKLIKGKGTVLKKVLVPEELTTGSLMMRSSVGTLRCQLVKKD